MRATSQLLAFSRMSSYRSGRGKGMASSHLTATMGQMSRGTPRNTSPAPVRRAPRAASTGAPV